LQDLLPKLLSIDPKDRISLEEAARHPFLAKGNSKFDFRNHVAYPENTNLTLPMKTISAVVCGDDYQFESCNLPRSMPTGYMAFQPPPVPPRSYSCV
jgi:serine/threonine protein kinase